MNSLADRIEALDWKVQFQRFNAKPNDKDLIHFAKTRSGTFEIYDNGKDFLLSKPSGPAELFQSLDDAKSAALRAKEKTMPKLPEETDRTEMLPSVLSVGEAVESCPFCGSIPHHGPTKVEHCQLHGEPFQRYEHWCPRGCARINRVNREQSLAAWNTRPQPTDLVEAFAAIAALTADCGSVTMLPMNDEANYKSAQIGVDVCAEWTDWKDRRFMAETHVAALIAAHTAFREKDDG